MLIVDTHVHVALHTYEPVEMLLAQMQLNEVEKTVLVQSTTTTDNTYVIECMRRFPGRFSVVCRVDVDSPQALQDLEGQMPFCNREDLEWVFGKTALSLWKFP